jgi:hypothetical protein
VREKLRRCESAGCKGKREVGDGGKANSPGTASRAKLRKRVNVELLLHFAPTVRRITGRLFYEVEQNHLESW